MVVTLARLSGPVRDYAWGSRSFLADLQGRPSPTDLPEAELWFGTHPTGPASVDLDDGTTRRLDALIAQDPVGVLGREVLERFGPRLPFLVKLLAAAEPLSLQAHPSSARAAAGFADEEARALPIDAPERRYRDPWPKPEILRALTPFRALGGFRSPARTLELLDRLDVDELQWVQNGLRSAAAADGTVLAGVVRRLLTLPEGPREELVAAVAAGARRMLTDALDSAPWAAEARTALELSSRYPSDPGVVVALLLNLVELAPGEAIHFPPGNLHAYLEGAGVEVMAASDNVLRGGLTAKLVDVDELLQVLEVGDGGVPRVATRGALPGERVFAAPTPFFRLSEFADGEVELDRRGPQILLCTHGDATIAADPAVVRLTPGQAAFVTAAAHRVTVAVRPDPAGAPGLLVRVTPGDA